MRAHLPVAVLKLRQLCPEPVSEYEPPQSRSPSWLWYSLVSGSAARRHELLVEGRKTSADCVAPTPPVMRMAVEVKCRLKVSNALMF